MTSSGTNKKQAPQPGNSYLKYAGMAFQMAGVMLVFLFVGKKIDQYYQLETSYFTMLGAVVGVLAALYLTLKDFIFNKK